MKSKYLFRAIALLILLAASVPADSARALFTEVLPPVDMFQLPWEQGKSWVALDGFDNGSNRALNSPHNYLKGGAVDFAPHNNMQLGEDTSNYWVTAAATGIVIEKSSCALKIDHGNGWTSEYQFLANIQVKVGDPVFRNQRLAVIADGLGQLFCLPILPDTALGPPHLHFSVRPNMRNATFAGWVINYVPYLNKTTFTRNGQTLGLFQPLLNAPNLQIVLREPLTWDTVYIGNVDAYRYEKWPFVLSETTNFTLTATPTTSGLVPLLILLDDNGSEITRATGSLTSTQSAGNYFVQVQPQAGSGFYNLLLHKNSQPEPTGPYVSTSVVPTSINVGGIVTATVKLGNVPDDGYTSAEFTCTYNAGMTEVSNIAVADLFGPDPVMAINGPQNGSFIVAIAGSKDNKAITSGTVFTFNVKGLQAGQTAIECKARISKGDNVLTDLQSIGATLTVLGSTPIPTATSTPVIFPTPIPPAATPSPTPASALCDKAEFVADLITPPGTVILPGSYFAKGWRLKNVGTCVWTPAYAWTFVSGDQMDTNLSVTLADNIYPGQYVEVFVSGVAPGVSGHYQSFWKLRNASGVQFGSGDSASNPFLLDIVVSGPTVTPTLTSSPTVEPGWLVFANSKYGFQFLYPNQSQIEAGRTDNYARIDLPFVQGTNLGHKYLEINVAENANPCRSPVAASSIVNSSGTVTFNGLTFLKEIGGDAAAGNLYQFIAYSTLKNNVCVSLSFVLHSLNPGNFQTPPPVFDYAAETAVFEQIVSTYTWLSLPTATPIITSTSTPGVSPSPTGTATPISGAILTGQVTAAKVVTVRLYGPDQAFVAAVNANQDGTFRFDVPAGTYTIVATANGFLRIQGTVMLADGDTHAMPAIALLAGDIDDNNAIDQFDAMTIGMSYNTAEPPGADLNNDGIINVLDLELLASNYRKTGPIIWQ